MAGPAKEMELTNSTMDKFTGSKKRSWMMQRQQEINYSPSGYDGTAGQEQRLSSMSLRRMGEDGNTRTTTLNSQTGMIHRSEGLSEHQRQRIAIPPTLEAAEAQGHSTSKNAQVSEAQVLPSPAPSDDMHYGTNAIVDLEDENQEVTVNSATTNAPTADPVDSHSARLTELAAKYGGVEGIERLLQQASPEKGLDTLPEVPRPHDLYEAGSGHNILGSLDTNQLRFNANNEHRAVHQPSTQRPINQPAPLGNKSMGFPDTNLISVLNSRLKLLASRRPSHGFLEEGRLMLLKEASEKGDIFYLMLHQILCLFSVDRSTASKIAGLGHAQQKGFRIIEEFIRPNAELNPGTVEWFSTFPKPIETFINLGLVHHHIYQEVLRCLTLLSLRWKSFVEQKYQQKIPPLATPLVMTFGMRSVVLQRVTFLTIHRSLWIGDQDECFREGEKLFAFDQDTSRAWTVQPPPGRAIPQAEISTFYDKLVLKYRGLQAQHGLHLQRAGTNVRQSQSYMVESGSPMGPPHQNPVANSASPNLRSGWATAQVPPQVRLTSQVLPSSDSTGSLPVATQNIQPRPHSVYNSQRSFLLSPESQYSTAVQLPSAPLHTISFPLDEAPLQPNLPRASSADNYQPPNIVEMQAAPGPEPSRRPRGRPPGSGQRSQPWRVQPRQQSWNTPPASSTAAASSALPRHSEPIQDTHHRLTPSVGIPSPQDTGPSSQGNPLTLARSQPSPQQQILPSVWYRPSFVQQPNPAATALHQAHLRDVILVAADDVGSNESKGKFYQTLRRFAFQPQSLKQKTGSLLAKFEVSTQDWEGISSNIRGYYGSPSTRKVSNGSLIYRLRCVNNSDLNPISESQWAVAETQWPDTIAIIFNSTSQDIRRKAHHGKDLPIDLTPCIQQGINSLQISTLGRQQEEEASYSIAVEIIEVVDDATAKRTVGKVSQLEMQEFLRQRLARDSPDVQVTDGCIVVDIVDPFSLGLIQTPVRGQACSHYQCFDLDIFLQTRRGSPCSPEQFKCPICSTDARPQCLVYDEWTASVIARVKELDRSDARCVILDHQANWHIKEEREEGEAGDGTGRRKSRAEEPTARAGNVPLHQESEVIEID
ncbi:hypothetical protein MMC20_005278 [Loxospora ochrophaea]|nr:hypothetical protein [Loxospora ochrophaea]